MKRWFVLLGLLASAAAFGREEILAYDGDVAVGTDAALRVTESIRVRAEGRDIRRGIYRDFPTDYRDAQGRNVSVTFEVLATRRNDSPEASHQERRGNGVRLYLGSANRFLDHGEHGYEIEYRTVGQLGFFDGFDELYWNVTGNGWDFPINAATATIRLPGAVEGDALRLACYTGPQGSTEQACRFEVTEPGVVRFEATRSLGAREGLTVAVGFPKGLVTPPPPPPVPPATTGAPPSGAQGLAGPVRAPEPSWRLRARQIFYLLGPLLVLGFWIRAWREVGRDPEPGVIVPRYESPNGLSPAALRYVRRMKYDATCLAAALVNLAVKGALTIHQKRWFFSRKFSVQRTDRTPDALAPGERAVLDELLGSRSTFEFDKSDHKVVQRALKAHKAELEKEHKQRHFRLNRDRVVMGAVLSLVVAAIELWLGGPPPIIELIIINLVFAWLIKAHTHDGRDLLDAIEGLKLYLGVAERDTFHGMDRPRTLEEFERLLPFAVSLDCASTWVDRFEDVLEELERTGELARRGWVSGSGHITADSIVKSVDGLASGLGNAISSSSTPPGSSSGSGGGGFSGGGGGGGGGGGW